MKAGRLKMRHMTAGGTGWSWTCFCQAEMFTVASESAILLCSGLQISVCSDIRTHQTPVSLMALMADLAGGLQPKENRLLWLKST